MTRRQWLLLGAGLLVLGLVKVALVGWYLLHDRQPAAPEPVACATGSAACALPDGAVLRFVDPPVQGRPFTLVLDGVAAGVEPNVEFTMRDMDMGFNRYRFVRAGKRWQARVTLPACVSGSRDWLMTVSLDGRRYRLPLRVTH